jgi:hypothetical protein
MRFLVLILALGCAGAGSTTVAPAPTATNGIPAGTYELLLRNDTVKVPGWAIQLAADGNLQVTQDGTLIVRSRLVTSAGGVVEFSDQDGPLACRSNPGRYRVERTVRGWRFHGVSDACEIRWNTMDGGTLVISR